MPRPARVHAELQAATSAPGGVNEAADVLSERTRTKNSEWFFMVNVSGEQTARARPSLFLTGNADNPGGLGDR